MKTRAFALRWIKSRFSIEYSLVHASQFLLIEVNRFYHRFTIIVINRLNNNDLKGVS